MATVIGLPGKGITSVASTLGPGGRVIWHPQRMQAALQGAVAPAARDFQRAAALASPSRTVASQMFTKVFATRATVGSTSPLANLLQAGAKPHIIGDVGQKLAIGSDVVTGPVVHPGFEGRPFMKRLLPTWPAMYRTRARAALRAS